MPPIHHLSSIYLYISQRSITKTDRQTDTNDTPLSPPTPTIKPTQMRTSKHNKKQKGNPSSTTQLLPPSHQLHARQRVLLLKPFASPPLALERNTIFTTIQVPRTGQPLEHLVGLGLDSLAQPGPNGPMARQPQGPGPADLTATAVAATAVAEDESMGHSVQQGAEDMLSRLSRKRLTRVCFLDLDEDAGMLVC